MNDLERLTLAFQKMDDWGRKRVLATAERHAQKHPAKPRPILRLLSTLENELVGTASNSVPDKEAPVVPDGCIGLPALTEWMCDWWRKNKRTLRETDVRVLLTTFATMDEEGRQFTIATSSRRAERFPASKPRPHLHLVASSPSVCAGSKPSRKGCRPSA